MREELKTIGIVLRASSVGEFDRRLVLLSRERGKITVFARGAKRPGNLLMAASRPFSFGNFTLYEGREAYNLKSAEISNYFAELSENMEKACYGSYFLEFTDYYTRENVNETEMLKLLYQSLRALLKPSLPNCLIQRIFELRAMVINGEYTEHPQDTVCDSTNYTWEFVLSSPIESLYTFNVSEFVQQEFAKSVERSKRCYIDQNFHSLDILESLM